MGLFIRIGNTMLQRIVACCTAAVLLNAFVAPAHAAPGELDVRFGNGGRLVVPSAVQAVVMQPDGKFLFVDGATTLQVRRFLPNGAPDTQFGQGGRIEVRTPAELQATELSSIAAALQPDGKLLIGGQWSDAMFGGRLRFIVRLDLTQGGALDPTFGNNGVSDKVESLYGYEKLIALGGGDIVAVVRQEAPSPPNAHLMLWFDSSGRSLASRPVVITDVAALDAESVVVLARTSTGSSLSRMQRSGLDSQFGSSGASPIESMAAERVAVDRLGRIVVCGGAEFRRYTPTGAPEWQAQFASWEMQSCIAVAADASGRVVAVGASEAGPSGYLFVVRLGANGSSDPALVENILRLRSPPTETWRSLDLSITATGDARMAWLVQSPALQTNTPVTARGKAVVDALDLGGDVSSSAVGVPLFEPRAMERAGYFLVPVARSGGSGTAASARYQVLAGTAGADDVELASGTLTWAAGDNTQQTIFINLRDDSVNEGEETFSVRLDDGNGVVVPVQPLSVVLVDDEALRSLRFAPVTLTWEQSSTGPWPSLQLARDVATPGPVTAYYLFNNGDNICCVGGVRWEAGNTSTKSIGLTQQLGLGISFYALLIDDEWVEAGPAATVNVRLQSNLPPVTPPVAQPPSGGGSGGGGAVGPIDMLFLLAFVVVLVARSFRDARGGSACLGALISVAGVTPAEAGPGDLNMGFASRGRLAVPIRDVPGVALNQADGKLLVIDYPPLDSGTDYDRLQLRRYNTDGTPDLQFGQAGSLVCRNPANGGWLSSAALQPDGKLLIGGSAGQVGSEPDVAFIARLVINSGCAADPTFGMGGIAAGGPAPGNGFGPGPGYERLRVLANGEIVAVRLNATGTSQSAHEVDWFSATGERVSGWFGDVAAIESQDDSAVVLLVPERGVLRLQRSGYDTTFGTSGTAALQGMNAQGIAVDGSGRIVVCGAAEFRRLTARGEPDPSFGVDGSGRVRLATVHAAPFDSCRGVATDSSGRVVAVGSDLSPSGAELQTYVFRLRTDGSLDAVISDDGKPSTLRGITPPTQTWRESGMQLMTDGNARVAWIRNQDLIIDEIELGVASSPGTVGIAALDPRAMERAGAIDLAVVRSGSSSNAASVRYQVVPGTAGADDVDLASGTLSWPAGDASRRTLRIALNNDSLNEGEESFSVRLFDGNGIVANSDAVSVTLIDDDALRALRFSPAGFTWQLLDPWPGLSLIREIDTRGPVTAYIYFSNSTQRCCLQSRTWKPGDLSAAAISPQIGSSSDFTVTVIDDEWQPAGPAAAVTVKASPPVTPPVVQPPPPSGGGGGGGGGMFGLTDLLLSGLGAIGLLARRRYGSSSGVRLP